MPSVSLKTQYGEEMVTAEATVLGLEDATSTTGTPTLGLHHRRPPPPQSHFEAFAAFHRFLSFHPRPHLGHLDGRM